MTMVRWGRNTMKAFSAFAIAIAIATSAFAQQQQAIPAPTIFSIKAGETLWLRSFTWVTLDCVSTFIGLDGIDILDGPPEITLNFEPGQVNNVSTTAG
jgi:hypothetical protein